MDPALRAACARGDAAEVQRLIGGDMKTLEPAVQLELIEAACESEAADVIRKLFACGLSVNGMCGGRNNIVVALRAARRPRGRQVMKAYLEYIDGALWRKVIACLFRDAAAAGDDATCNILIDYCGIERIFEKVDGDVALFKQVLASIAQSTRMPSHAKRSAYNEVADAAFERDDLAVIDLLVGELSAKKFEEVMYPKTLSALSRAKLDRLARHGLKLKARSMSKILVRACERSDLEMVSYVLPKFTVDDVINCGALKSTVQPVFSWTPYRVENAALVVRKLLAHGLPAEHVRECGVLRSALNRGYYEIVKALIEFDPSVPVTDDDLFDEALYSIRAVSLADLATVVGIGYSAEQLARVLRYMCVGYSGYPLTAFPRIGYLHAAGVAPTCESIAILVKKHNVEGFDEAQLAAARQTLGRWAGTPELAAAESGLTPYAARAWKALTRRAG